MAKSKLISQPLSLAVKIILALSILNALYFNLWHIMSTSIFLLFLMFIPQIMKKSYKIKFPKEFEILLLIFVVATFFIGRFQGAVVPIFFGIAMGFVSFMVILILYSRSNVKKNYFLIILSSLSISLSLALSLELIKYYLKVILGYGLQEPLYAYTMNSFSYVLVGAVISSLLGYIYMKTRKGALGGMMEKFMKTNPKLFTKQENSPTSVLKLIKKGESNFLEFKSTLRTNLFTNEKDPKIEHSVLKTIAAFLNSGGGTLIIGISDKGKITGIEKDNFPNKDKFTLHFTNLFKKRIGRKYLNLINFNIIPIKKKNILKIDCLKSKKPIFLRIGEDEEFYIRAGPSSAKLAGSNLVEYIEQRFKRSK